MCKLARAVLRTQTEGRDAPSRNEGIARSGIGSAPVRNQQATALRTQTEGRDAPSRNEGIARSGIGSAPVRNRQATALRTQTEGRDAPSRNDCWIAQPLYRGNDEQHFRSVAAISTAHRQNLRTDRPS